MDLTPSSKALQDMSIKRGCERRDTDPPIDSVVASFEKVSLSNADQSSPGLSTCLTHKRTLPELPTEVWTSIAQHAFSPCPTSGKGYESYFTHGQPDLTLMRVNRQLRNIFQQTILPNTLMILVRHRTCRYFPPSEKLDNHAPYTHSFASDDSEPCVAISQGGISGFYSRPL